MADYPDGYQRSLPGHTVELDPGYAVFWQSDDSVSLPSGIGSTSTHNISGAGYIFFADTISVFGDPIVPVRVILKRGTTTLDAQAHANYVKFTPRDNPSMYWLDGESIDVWIMNNGTVTSTIYIYVNGSKIKRPAGFVRV